MTVHVVYHVMFALTAIYSGNRMTIERVGMYASYHQCMKQAAVIDKAIINVINAEHRVLCIPVNE